MARLTNQMLRYRSRSRYRRRVLPPSQAAGPQVAPDPLVWNRTRRGSEPRYWDTVSSGDAIPDLPKGTYTTTELYLFSHGALSTRRARYVDEGTKLMSVVINKHVVFEADGHSLDEGWSVIVQGTAEVLSTSAEIDEADRAGLRPWVATLKLCYVRIQAATISGRRFRFGPEPDRESTFA